jgi:hypothetical protein
MVGLVVILILIRGCGVNLRTKLGLLFLEMQCNIFETIYFNPSPSALSQGEREKVRRRGGIKS